MKNFKTEVFIGMGNTVNISPNIVPTSTTFTIFHQKTFFANLYLYFHLRTKSSSNYWSANKKNLSKIFYDICHIVYNLILYKKIFALLKNFAMVRKFKTRISISFHTLTAIAHQSKKLKIQLHTLKLCTTCIFCIGRIYYMLG